MVVISLSDYLPGLKTGNTSRNIILILVYIIFIPFFILLYPFYFGFALAKNRNGIRDSISNTKLAKIPWISSGGIKSGISGFILIWVFIIVIVNSLSFMIEAGNLNNINTDSNGDLGQSQGIEVKDLEVHPSEINSGDSVRVTAMLENSGDTASVKKVILTIGNSEFSSQVFLEPNETKEVVFNEEFKSSGTYEVAMSGLTEQVEVIGFDNQEFIDWFENSLDTVSSDLASFTEANNNYDIESAFTYSKSLSRDTDDMLNTLEDFAVSEDLKTAKMKCQKGLQAINTGAETYYDTMKQVEEGTMSYDEAENKIIYSKDKLDEGSEYLLEAEELIKEHDN